MFVKVETIDHAEIELNVNQIIYEQKLSSGLKVMTPSGVMFLKESAVEKMRNYWQEVKDNSGRKK